MSAAADALPVEAKPIGEFARVESGDDPSEILRYRFLCRGGGALFAGPTGVGKSSAVMQCCALWANGRDFFGIHPAFPLRIAIAQAENDEGDMADMRDGIAAGLELTREERQRFFENVIVRTEFNSVGPLFCNGVLRPLLTQYKPDLLVIDPALAYIGGNSKEQSDVGAFLRNYLNPVVKEQNAAVIIVHHTNKPQNGEQKATWQHGDFAYLGSGSAEWANWARAVLALQSTGTRGVFRLHGAKRGARLRWTDDDGAATYEKLIAHSRTMSQICWRESNQDELPNPGRPKKHNLSDLIAKLPDSGLSNTAWNKASGLTSGTFRRLRDEAIELGLVLESVTGSYLPKRQKCQNGH